MRTIWSVCQGCNVWYKKVIPQLQRGKEKWRKLLYRAYPPKLLLNRTTYNTHIAHDLGVRQGCGEMERALLRSGSPPSRRLWGMRCGGPRASAWNLGNYGNGPAGDNKHGLEFQRSQPGHGGMGKFGKVFLFVFYPGLGGGSTGGSCGAPNKRSLPGTPTESQGGRFSRSLYLHLILFTIYSPPHSTKHCTGSKGAPEGWRCTADPCLSGRRAAPKSQSLRTAPSASSQFSLTTALRPGWPGPHFTQGGRKFREPRSEGGLPNPAHPSCTRPSHL